MQNIYLKKAEKKHKLLIMNVFEGNFEAKTNFTQP